MENKLTLFILLISVVFLSTTCNEEENIVPSNSSHRPIAFFEVSHDNILLGDTIYIVNKSEYCESFDWDFGDGCTSEEESPLHIYKEIGEFEVNLYVRNSYGKDFFTKIITVLPDSPIVNIPDMDFLDLLLNKGLDINSDGQISYREALMVRSLKVNYGDISDMTGIEAFTNLESLTVVDIDVQQLNISTLVNLKTLVTGIGSIRPYSIPIEHIDLSNNTKLEVFVCHWNPIENLELTNNIHLKELDIGCTKLTNIDLTNNTKLEILDAHMLNLNQIDLSNNTNLREMDLSKSKLRYLDISNNVNLTSIGLDNANELEEICVWVLPFPPPGVSISTETDNYTMNCR